MLGHLIFVFIQINKIEKKLFQRNKNNKIKSLLSVI
jgi:hypothetical protein